MRPEIEQLVREQHQRRAARGPATCRAGVAASAARDERSAGPRRGRAPSGSAVQNRLPTTAMATMSKPRQWIEVRTVARLRGASCGPSRPCSTTASGDQEQQSCSAVRRDASGGTSRRRAGAGCSCARRRDGRRRFRSASSADRRPAARPVTSRIQSPAIVNCSGASYTPSPRSATAAVDRRHAGMGHQALEPQARASHRLLIAIAKRQARDDGRADDRWRRIERPGDADGVTGSRSRSQCTSQPGAAQPAARLQTRTSDERVRRWR